MWERPRLRPAQGKLSVVRRKPGRVIFGWLDLEAGLKPGSLKL